MGRRPLGLLVPARVSAMACEPPSPGYQASRMASAFCWAQVTARAEPFMRTTTSGLPAGFEELLLRGGQGDVGAVAAREAGDVYGHLFAFEVGGEADEGEDYVGLFDDVESLSTEGFDGGDPLEGEASAEETGAVGVGDFEGVGLGVVEVEFDGGGCRSVLGFVFADLEGEHVFAIE